MQENDAARGEGRNPLADHWATLKSWHGEASFWREVYVRMLAALGAAGVIYVIAALAGLVTARPVAVVGVVIVAVTTPFLLYWWADMIVHWKDLRISHDWSLTPPRNDAERRIRRVYSKAFSVSVIFGIGVALIVIGVGAEQ